jgi:uncharacterized membrane protein YfcA
MHLVLPVAVGIVALLYAAVGHAGATGYIAVMTLLGLPQPVIRPTALSLNVLVATIATVQFFRAGHFRGRLLWPLAVASVPCAALGGAIDLPMRVFEQVVGIVLLFSAVQIGGIAVLGGREADSTGEGRQVPSAGLAALGGAIGLLSGLTGVGGGVFLTPTLLLLRAAPIKEIAAITAPFILVNSLSGLAGGIVAGRGLAAVSLPVIGAAIVGGAVGAQLGAFRMPAQALRLVLAGVLGFASLKLLGGG